MNIEKRSHLCANNQKKCLHRIMKLQEYIDQSTQPILVDVYTTACGPCRRMMPLVDELKAEGHNVTKLNAYDDSEFCHQHQIDAVPTFLVFKEGKVVNRLTGIQTKEALIKALRV